MTIYTGDDDPMHMARWYLESREPAYGVLPRPPVWMRDAACAGMDPDLFVPEHGGPSRKLRRVCHGCPVRVECLDYATREALPGLWGGTTDAERLELRKTAS